MKKIKEYIKAIKKRIDSFFKMELIRGEIITETVLGEETADILINLRDMYNDLTTNPESTFMDDCMDDEKHKGILKVLHQYGSINIPMCLNKLAISGTIMKCEYKDYTKKVISFQVIDTIYMYIFLVELYIHFRMGDIIHKKFPEDLLLRVNFNFEYGIYDPITKKKMNHRELKLGIVNIKNKIDDFLTDVYYLSFFGLSRFDSPYNTYSWIKHPDVYTEEQLKFIEDELVKLQVDLHGLGNFNQINHYV